MAANVQTMFYAGEKPWHGLGVKVESELTAAEAIAKAGLDWQVKKSEMKDAENGQTIPNHYNIKRMDSGKSLGVVGNIYNPMQNREAFSFFDSMVGSQEAIYHTAGALGGGEKIWILAKVGGVLRIKGSDDTIEKYVLLSNSHDGSSNLRIALTPIRVVCQNTLYQAIQSAERLFKIRHTNQMGNKVLDARDALGMVNQFFVDFQAKADSLAAKQVNRSLWETYLEALGFDPDAKEGRERETVRVLTNLFESGKGNKMEGVKGTAWAAYNAVTEYLTHERSTRVTNGFADEKEARLNSLWFGSSQKLNGDAFDKAIALTR